MNKIPKIQGPQLVLPVVLGVGVIITSIIVYKLYFSKPTGRGKPKKILLKDPQAKYKLPLIEKQTISHDTRNFRFALPEKDMVLERLNKDYQLVNTYIYLLKLADELVIRSYTPVSSDDDYGYMDLVIKVYLKNVHPKFPDGGKLTQYLESLKIGDTIDIRGPSGRLQYLGHGKFSIKKLRKDPPTIVNVTRVGLIAGGVGITPILQLSWREIAEKDPDRFKFWYTLDKAEEGWKYSTGFVNEDMLKEHLFPPSKDTLILMCGPPPMVNYACLPNLEKIGHDKDMCFAY
ncbi:hypothetical protein NQ317_019391 [Molorchus minor]|uniref:FAD-binding FR-type domain-containing protein n=1 Tax=Molorchus minor TaxID=1323400 RepID=A0ABQ9JD53_9CUCU|nr:hypothetical protein NQ317_019391 [Molorchus minor]